MSDSDEEAIEDLDDPDEPIMEGSDEFEDLYDDLNEDIDEGRDVKSCIYCKLVLITDFSL